MVNLFPESGGALFSCLVLAQILFVIRIERARLPVAVSINRHGFERQRFDRVAVDRVQISIFIPTDRVQHEIPNPTGTKWFGRLGEGKTDLIPPNR